MEIQYVYTKVRQEFGKQCLFSDDGPKFLESLTPNKAFAEDYILKDPVDRPSQCSTTQAEHWLNTERTEYENRGMNHTEGGWPKDVNHMDIEHTARYRKKVEKDELYATTIIQLAKKAQLCVVQNNAINIYQDYFQDTADLDLLSRSSARTVNAYRDPNSTKRPANRLSWSPDGGKKIAVTHCNLEFQRPHDGLESYVWEIENPNKPLLDVKTFTPIVCLEFHPKDITSLVGGLYTGQVAFWDTRKGSGPVEMSVLEYSHRDPVHCVLWINTKSGSEFFSASPDGQVKWWDSRKLSEPSETLILDVTKGEDQVLSRAFGAFSLEYEPSIPTRFMVGSENGIVINCNRKGKSAAEKISTLFPAHLGPVRAVQRNPGFTKNFLTIGDWVARIWAEDCKESSILWTHNHRAYLTDGCWSPERYSVYNVTRKDGILDVWDILQQQKAPILSVRVCEESLQCLRSHDSGQFMAVGTSEGTAYLIEYSESLATSQPNDKVQLTRMFDRENRREKIMEARLREQKLKQKAAKAPEILPVDGEGPARVSQGPAQADIAAQKIEQAEANFFAVIEQEKQKAFITAEDEDAAAKPEGEAETEEGAVPAEGAAPPVEGAPPSAEGAGPSTEEAGPSAKEDGQSTEHAVAVSAEGVQPATPGAGPPAEEGTAPPAPTEEHPQPATTEKPEGAVDSEKTKDE